MTDSPRWPICDRPDCDLPAGKRGQCYMHWDSTPRRDDWVHRLSAVDLEAKTATCQSCGPVKVKVNRTRGKPSPQCMVAVMARKKASARAQRLRTEYGLSLDDFDQLVASQDGRCAICHTIVANLFVDHNHETGVVRGLLCQHCNTGIGHLGDSPERLLSAVRYLRRER